MKNKQRRIGILATISSLVFFACVILLYSGKVAPVQAQPTEPLFTGCDPRLGWSNSNPALKWILSQVNLMFLQKHILT